MNHAAHGWRGFTQDRNGVVGGLAGVDNHGRSRVTASATCAAKTSR